MDEQAKLFKGILNGLIISAIIVLIFVVVAKVSAEPIGKVQTSGMLFKDSIEIHAFNDPNYSSITCYVTLPKRSMSFDDQTNSSISCRKITNEKVFASSRKNIFQASKGAFAKKLTIDRFYDKKRNVLIYIAYTKKLSGDNASHSLSVVPLNR